VYITRIAFLVGLQRDAATAAGRDGDRDVTELGALAGVRSLET